MDENGEILLLHASKNNARPFEIPFYMTLIWGYLCDTRSLRKSLTRHTAPPHFREVNGQHTSYHNNKRRLLINLRRKILANALIRIDMRFFLIGLYFFNYTVSLQTYWILRSVLHYFHVLFCNKTEKYRLKRNESREILTV